MNIPTYSLHAARLAADRTNVHFFMIVDRGTIDKRHCTIHERVLRRFSGGKQTGLIEIFEANSKAIGLITYLRHCSAPLQMRINLEVCDLDLPTDRAGFLQMPGRQDRRNIAHAIDDAE